MEVSKMPYRTWAIGLYLYLTNIKGISAMRLHRELGISQKSAWFMLHRIGIDISPKAAELVEMRTEKELGFLFQDVFRDDIPQRTDVQSIRRYNHPDNKKSLYGEQGGHCNGCDGHFKQQNLTIDHIIPRSKGGTDHLTNLQLLSGHCNSVKGDRGQEYLIAKLPA